MKRLIDENKNYEYYLHWQQVKTSKPSLRNELLKEFDKKTSIFEALFSDLKKHSTQENKKVLCLGARMGEEVQAFLNLGYDAIGIDLVENLPLVIKGDFNNLPYEDNSVDIVYTNAIDHCWQIDNFTDSIQRVVKSNGLIVLHLCVGRSKEFESYHIDSAEEVTNLFTKSEIIESNDKFGINLHFGGLNHEIIMRKK